MRYMDLNNTRRYVGMLTSYQRAVNQRVNSQHGFRPIDVGKLIIVITHDSLSTRLDFSGPINSRIVFDRLYPGFMDRQHGNKIATFPLGSIVKVKVAKSLLKHTYYRTYSSQHYRIIAIFKGFHGVNTYKLGEISDNTPIYGRFYSHDLTHFQLK